MTNDRKKIKHFHRPGDFHELTFSCYGQRPLLADGRACRLLCESIDRAMTRHATRLVAFVLMPEHVHLLVFPASLEPDIDALLFAIKRPFSFRIKEHYEVTGNPLRSELIVRERAGKETFRFWQEGPGYDRNLSDQNQSSQRLSTFTSIRSGARWSVAPRIGSGRAVDGTSQTRASGIRSCRRFMACRTVAAEVEDTGGQAASATRTSRNANCTALATESSSSTQRAAG